MAPGGMAAPGMGMNMNMMGGAAMNLFRPNMPLQAPAPGVNPKKQRELYVGNVPTGQVSEPMLKELFSQILQQCGGFDPGGGAPVMNVQLRAAFARKDGWLVMFMLISLLGPDVLLLFARVQLPRIGASISKSAERECAPRTDRSTKPQTPSVTPPSRVLTVAALCCTARSIMFWSAGLHLAQDLPALAFNVAIHVRMDAAWDQPSLLLLGQRAWP